MAEIDYELDEPEQLASGKFVEPLSYYACMGKQQLTFWLFRLLLCKSFYCLLHGVVAPCDASESYEFAVEINGQKFTAVVVSLSLKATVILVTVLSTKPYIHCWVFPFISSAATRWGKGRSNILYAAAQLQWPKY
jgi:hypothetical protein